MINGKWTSQQNINVNSMTDSFSREHAYTLGASIYKTFTCIIFKQLTENGSRFWKQNPTFEDRKKERVDLKGDTQKMNINIRKIKDMKMKKHMDDQKSMKQDV